MRPFTFLLITCLLGCTPVAYLIYGVHKPRPLSQEQMKKKYTELGFNQYKVLALNEDIYYQFLSKIKTVNSVLVFNNDGYYLRPKNEFTCSNDKIEYIKNYRMDSLSIIDSTFDLRFLSNCITIFNGNESRFIDSSLSYTMVLTFADFVGQLNRDITLKQLELLLKDSKTDTDLILLALDPIKRVKRTANTK